MSPSITSLLITPSCGRPQGHHPHFFGRGLPTGTAQSWPGSPCGGFMPGGVVPAVGAGVAGGGSVICCVAGMAAGAAPAGGALESEAPTGISHRCPGSPCGGLGSVTTAVGPAGACASVGMGVTVVAGAPSASVAAPPAAGEALSTDSSCPPAHDPRMSNNENPNVRLACMIINPGSMYVSEAGMKVGNLGPVLIRPASRDLSCVTRSRSTSSGAWMGCWAPISRSSATS